MISASEDNALKLARQRVPSRQGQAVRSLQAPTVERVYPKVGHGLRAPRNVRQNVAGRCHPGNVRVIPVARPRKCAKTSGASRVRRAPEAERLKIRGFNRAAVPNEAVARPLRAKGPKVTVRRPVPRAPSRMTASVAPPHSLLQRNGRCVRFRRTAVRMLNATRLRCPRDFRRIVPPSGPHESLRLHLGRPQQVHPRQRRVGRGPAHHNLRAVNLRRPPARAAVLVLHNAHNRNPRRSLSARKAHRPVLRGRAACPSGHNDPRARVKEAVARHRVLAAALGRVRVAISENADLNSMLEVDK